MNFRFKVIKSLRSDKAFTVGNVYEAENGCVVGDNYTFTTWSDEGATFDNLKKWFEEYFVFELVTDDSPNNNSVNHPSHYNKGKIEVADFISDQKLNFDRGNAVKYVCRAGSKDPEKEIQDLEKAIWYINHEIKILKGDIENGTEEENA